MGPLQAPITGGRRRARNLPRRALIALALAALTVAALAVTGVIGNSERAPATTAEVPAASTPPAPGTVPVAVRVQLRHPGRAVPARYLGLSFEAADLRRIAAYGATGNFVTMLRSLGPGLLRFGGISADTRIAWVDHATPQPSWTALALEARDLSTLRVLAERSGWRVLLTIGLAHYDAASAAREAAAAKSALGPWLAGIEIGNEPDAYGRHKLRASPWRYRTYDAEVKRYRAAIAKLAPGIPLAGPGVSGSRAFIRWGPHEVSALAPVLLTGHHYPLGCHQVPPPSIERLLSRRVRVSEAASLQRYMKVSRATGVPFRMDEANSVSCGGSAGISDTFAATLWATSYIAQTMAAGVSGINLEGNPANCFGYSPVCAADPAQLASGTLTAQPVWYSLLLARSLIGDRPLHAAVSAPAGTNITVAALRVPGGGLHLVLVDNDPPGSHAAAVRVRVGPTFGAASELALTAPSPEATRGVRLGDQGVAADGSWQPPGTQPGVSSGGGMVSVTLAPSSAALVTVAPAG
ncbi:MAG TPA: hypothetical protein VF380_03415 [Solirubrobacteraceae bacterium]